MVLAYHLVLMAYGFWLPNDPRGSWSNFVRSFELYRVAGPATKTDTRRSVAGVEHDAAARFAAKRALLRPPVVFDGVQAREIARGFADYCTRNGRPVHAMAVMPDHAHLVVGRTGMLIEKVAEQLKARATSFLNAGGLHPFRHHPFDSGRLPTPWAAHDWHVFLSTPDEVDRAVRYVQDNPPNAGLRRQHYDWLVPFGG